MLNRVLNSSSDPQSSTTYRSFVQRYRECERNAGIQWSIDFSPHPRAWHIVSDDIIYAGSEMNVDTDEFLKSLKSLQVSRCECPPNNPDSDYPTRKPAPDSRRCTAGARPRPARATASRRLYNVQASILSAADLKMWHTAVDQALTDKQASIVISTAAPFLRFTSPFSFVKVFSMRISRYSLSAFSTAICAFSSSLESDDVMIFSTVPCSVES